MLSKKTAFSLVSLITLLVLAMVVLSAMAGDFEVKVEGRTTVTYATGEATVGVKLRVIADKSLPNPLVTNLSIFDKDGFPIAIDINNPQITVTDDTDYAMRTGRVRQLDADISVKINDGTVAKVVITVPKTATPDPTVPAADSMSKVVHHTIRLLETPMASSSRPQVVSIQRLRPSSQTVTSAFQEAEVTGAFDVRIVFTEKPHDFKLATINVEGGTASNLVVGVPFTWHGGRSADGTRNAAETLRPHPIEGMYAHSGTGALQGVPSGSDRVTVPLPSGDDDMYHQYRVTITPYQGVGMVKISIKEFHDGGSPFLNIYKPFNVDYKPNGREQLRLAVATTTMSLGTGVMLSLPHDDDVKITEKQKADATAADAAETVAAEKVKAEAATVAVKKAVDTSVRIPEVGQIYISEVMFAKSGTLTQWIEIANGSRTEQVNLSGWTLKVENATADANVSVGAKAVFTIPEGTRIDPSGQHDTPSTVLVVTEQGRNNLTGARADGQVVNLWTDQQLELFRLDIFKRRYSLLSDMAFKITLAPPAALITPPAVAADATDVVGNLGADGAATWALPMAEGHARSSIIRRHVAGSVGPAEPKAGEMMESWVLASDTGFAQATHLRAHSYYGLPIDVGTPGFRAGGVLPVELSQFRPARSKETGAVVITWSTQSELNNAGFFIKRSQQRDGQFKVINATMIAGAGTTSEKQFYTYTDTTAQASVVYYYQIEDVSLDGNRQTLTRGIRLKGHVGAAGKATVLWGELKSTN